MPGKLNVYGLGSLGVNVDRSDVDVEDSELRQAQNWQIDNIGERGAVRRRDGMDKWNTAGALAGSIKGIIGLPLPDPNTLTRRFYAPIDDHAGVATGAWRSSLNGTVWATSAVGSSPDVVEIIDSSQMGGAIVPAQIGAPWLPLNNKLYYIGQHAVLTNATDPPLKVFDGATDVQFSQITANPYSSGTRVGQVCGILPYDDQNLIVSTYDDNGSVRVLLVNVRTGKFTTLGPGTNLGGTFSALAANPVVYAGRIYFASYNLAGGLTSKVFWVRPGDTVWTRETNGDTPTGNTGFCIGAAVFKGDLYFSYSAAVGASSIIRKRTPAGVFSTVRTNASVVANNKYGGLATSPDGAKLYVFEDQTGGAGNTANKQLILSTTDGAVYTTEYDTGLNANNKYTAPGYPLFDANGDLLWVIVQQPAPYDAIIVKRTSAGVWSIVDNNAAHLRGQLARIKF